MSRRTLLAVVLALFLVPTIARAGWSVIYEVEEVQLQTGESARVRAHVEWRSGFSVYPFTPSTFFSSNPSVAFVDGVLPVSGHGFVSIKAASPGSALVRHTGDRSAFDGRLAITVTCGPTTPVRLEQSVLRTKVGETVTLTAIVDRPEDTEITWYEGRAGDRAKPLKLGSADLQFTPSAAGEHYVWVSAVNPCSNTSAEALIEAVQPRRRAVR